MCIYVSQNDGKYTESWESTFKLKQNKTEGNFVPLCFNLNFKYQDKIFRFIIHIFTF